MEIRIENLTEGQKEMLEFMWNELEDLEDFERWLKSLTSEEQEQAISLQRLIIIEMMEEMLADTTVAANYLKRFQLK